MAKKREKGPLRPPPGFVPLQLEDGDRLRELLYDCPALPKEPIEDTSNKENEKKSWIARRRPGIERKIRQFVDGTLLYNPKRHKQT